MAHTVNFASVSQSFVDRTICLAGFSILRLVRSPLAQHLDLAAGEQAFFQAVQFLKSVSLQPGDIGMRTALIMHDLWNSNKVFRRKDGRIESLGLRLRTRLSMSVSYDMFWYWREEFGNMQNPYNGDEAINASTEATQPGSPRKKTRLTLYVPTNTTQHTFGIKTRTRSSQPQTQDRHQYLQRSSLLRSLIQA